MRTIYRVSTFVLILISCIIVGIFYVLTTRNIELVYARDTHEAIYGLKQRFLEDTVNNQIRRIQLRKTLEVDHYQQLMEKSYDVLLAAAANQSEESFIPFFINHFSQRSAAGVWTAILWSPETGQIYLDTDGLITDSENIHATLSDEIGDFAVHSFAAFGDFEAFYGVRHDKVDAVVKEAIREDIHTSEFAEDSYLWINEIVNYDGGDNYAIRRVHPNMIETEGMYLSTNTTDIAGNFPYLEELEGVKEDGEVLFTYYFKRKDSDQIAEKLTYAKLYREYDWVVAMGVHLEDMDSYVIHANQASGEITRRLLPIFVLILVILVSGGYAGIVFLERWKTSQSRRALEEEVNRDPLTRAYNRRRGLLDLTRHFKEFSHGEGTNPAIIEFDLDDFKRINDTLGHGVGDQALRLVAETITSSLRLTDRLYRWGGDEFLIVCGGVLSQNAESFCTNLMMRYTEMTADAFDPALTISMGVSFFHPGDSSYTDVLERADAALYRAKRNGKNRIELS